MPAVGKPRRQRPPATHVIVHRTTGAVVSRHPSLSDAREAWRKRAFSKAGLIKSTLGTWAAAHLIQTVTAAANAASRRAIEAEKRSRA
ncbi:hypothetical protein MBRA_01056 [Methylobacterium brachiatum]|jgi:hypothetical protein|nr:hypothetical protein MBRA_01056 [Methylobacterium brachiatum]